MNVDLLALLQLILGPTGALALLSLILFGIGWGGWKLLTQHAIPGVKSWCQKQDERFETIMNEHREDRQVFKESVEQLSGRMDATDDKVNRLVEDLEDIKGRTFVCPRIDSSV